MPKTNKITSIFQALLNFLIVVQTLQEGIRRHTWLTRKIPLPREEAIGFTIHGPLSFKYAAVKVWKYEIKSYINKFSRFEMKTRMRLNVLRWFHIGQKLLTTEVLKFSWDYKAVWHKVEMFEALKQNTRSLATRFLNSS